MKLKDIEMQNLLPEFMQDDECNEALSEGVNRVIQMFARAGDHFSLWTVIDDLTEWELDKFAWEKDMTWYDYSADIETKRRLIKNSSEVKRNLGTPWAVEEVITAYFGTGFVWEWFEYNGEPGYFRVVSSNPAITNENIERFLAILNKIKRKSAHLEAIYIGLSGKSYLRTGAGFRETEIINVHPRRGEINGWKGTMYAGAGGRDIEEWKVCPVYNE
ncbi:MAG: phage tail protein [Anaerovoracaceae bacterium]